MSPSLSFGRKWRVVSAFLLAPLITAFALACAQPPYLGGLPAVLKATVVFALIGGYPAAILLGVPAFLILRRIARPSALNCAATGACVATLPWLALALVTGFWREAINFLAFLGIIATAGAVGGVVFWVIAVGISRHETTSA